MTLIGLYRPTRRASTLVNRTRRCLPDRELTHGLFGGSATSASTVPARSTSGTSNPPRIRMADRRPGVATAVAQILVRALGASARSWLWLSLSPDAHPGPPPHLRRRLPAAASSDSLVSAAKGILQLDQLPGRQGADLPGP